MGAGVVAAIFALVGAFVGVLGTLAVELTRRRTEDARSRRESLRLACADFTAAATRTRMLAMRVLEHPDDEAVRAAMYDSLLDARVYYERLRLISTSLDVQEAGRYALRYTTGITLLTEGKQPRKDERDRGSILLAHDSLLKLYAAVRSELNLPRPTDVYREPEEWLGWVGGQQVFGSARDVRQNE